MRILFAMLVATVTVASGLVRSYFVEPKSASLSGWTRTSAGRGFVSEVVTCCWDELDSASGSYVELFAGETLSGGYYKVDVYEYPGDTVRVAYNNGAHATLPQSWVKMPLTMVSGRSFTKGKKYEFRFTRGGGDSIQYYYDTMCGYHYGEILTPSFTSPTCGLAMRCLGRMNAVDSAWVGMDASVPIPVLAQSD